MEIKPFQGWRYRAADGDVSSRIAPPFDVLSQADKEALLGRDPRNIVAVDLPFCPPADVGPESVYDQAAATLKGWQADGVLARDERDSFYACEQVFTWGGRTYRRRAMGVAVRLVEFGQGVWPHEKTFAGPRADRLMLSRKTRMQLSPVFGFYEDGTGPTDALFAAAAARPDAAGTLHGVEERLWVVSDPAVVEQVRDELADRDVFIADGHHRYTTALAYRQSLGRIPPDHPANFVMFMLAAMDDPGLIILPPHRVITGLKDFRLERFILDTRGVMDCEPVRLTRADVADADAFLRGYGPHAMAFAAGEQAFVGRLKDISVMDRVAADQTQAWREVDVSILHRLLIEHYMAENRTNQMLIDYVADGPAALAAAHAGWADLVVFLQATPLEALKQVALAGAVMPHKSTYFYPKLPAGMVLYPLEE